MMRRRGPSGDPRGTIAGSLTRAELDGPGRKIGDRYRVTNRAPAAVAASTVRS